MNIFLRKAIWFYFRKLHHIMSELIKTEQDYVVSLEYIIEVSKF